MQVAGGALQSFAYDAVGNLTSKTGVGTGPYIYPGQGTGSVRPHAVQSITGVSGTFAYDANGNMLSSPYGRTQTWTSFDMPLVLGQGASSSQFLYGPEHQRVKQVRSDGTTIWYAGHIEVETTASQTKVKTYWPQGLGLETDIGGATQELWTHADRLGSIVAISDINGTLQVQDAFDAWGLRRNIDGTAASAPIVETVDNKGFTGQEMLDQLSLVHLNGRVYDPLLGKFMSADPHVTDPANGQNYNRYSYVLNNPTNSVDPTGFDSVGDSAKKSAEAEKSGAGKQIIRDCASGCIIRVVDSNGNVIEQGFAIAKPKEGTKSNGSGVQQSSAKGTDAKGNGETVNVTAADARQSIAAGFGNSIAKTLTLGANWLIAAFGDGSAPCSTLGTRLSRRVIFLEGKPRRPEMASRR